MEFLIVLQTHCYATLRHNRCGAICGSNAKRRTFGASIAARVTQALFKLVTNLKLLHTRLHNQYTLHYPDLVLPFTTSVSRHHARRTSKTHPPRRVQKVPPNRRAKWRSAQEEILPTARPRQSLFGSCLDIVSASSGTCSSILILLVLKVRPTWIGQVYTLHTRLRSWRKMVRISQLSHRLGMRKRERTSRYRGTSRLQILDVDLEGYCLLLRQSFRRRLYSVCSHTSSLATHNFTQKKTYS